MSVQAQISESWNLDIDSYTHNSSNYASKSPPIEIADFTNGDFVVLSQKGTLTKVSIDGRIIWRKVIDPCAQQRIVVDANDVIILSCGTHLTKFDSNGKTIWQKDFSKVFSKNYLTFDAFTSKEDTIYLVGHFFQSKVICQVVLDEKGEVVWKTKFNQKVDQDFSFVPPKEILVFENSVFILAHHFDKSHSFVYASDLNGKNRKNRKVDFKIKSLKIYKGGLYVLGHLNSFKDQLIFGKMNKELELSSISEFELPRNYEYEKAIRNWATKPPTIKEFEKEYITDYDINDFEFFNPDNLLIVGDSNNKPLVLSLDLKKGIHWNKDIFDDRYFKYFNKYTRHYKALYSISRIGNDYLISGISEEQDNLEDPNVKHINLYVRGVEIEN